MRIDNAETAHQWLYTWNQKPRLGVLKAAIDGLEMCARLTNVPRFGDEHEGYRAALQVLRAVYRERMESLDGPRAGSNL